MDGNLPVLGAANASSLIVNTPGFYWVKVRSVKNCRYDSPTQIRPLFNTLPSIKINGQARFCGSEPIVFNATTAATQLVWKIDGAVVPQFNNMTTADFSGMFSAGNNFVISCTVTTDGCSNTANHNITVEETIQDIGISVSITCNPYQVVVTATAVTSIGAPVHFNWSNGEAGWSNEPGGNMITLTDGGSYSVTATSGGCTFTKQIDIPKSPDNYLWVFPSGCYSDCSVKDPFLLGPVVPLKFWSWNNYGQAASSGVDFTAPFNLRSSGNYTLTINTGTCDMESDVLHYASDECEDCQIEGVEVQDTQANETPYCSYTQYIIIYSAASEPYQATISDPLNNVSIIPSVVTIQQGANYIQYTVIPQSPFMGGTTTLRLHGKIFDKENGTYTDCEYSFQIDVPYCANGQYKASKELDAEYDNAVVVQSCTLYPNPANGTVQLQYDLGIDRAAVVLYDITGRLLTQQTLSGAKGSTEINISNYAAGVYVVVVRNGSTLLYQQKLIIK
jgi:hypothetical protein